MTNSERHPLHTHPLPLDPDPTHGPTSNVDRTPAIDRPPATNPPPARRGQRRARAAIGARLVAFDDPRRWTPKPVGVADDGPPLPVSLRVPDARHHGHVLGQTGSGKSTQLCRMTVAEARAGRGVALFDCQGDLVRATLDRLPASCGQRLVVIDPDETDAPPAWNPLHADTAAGRELAAENVVGVFRRLYSQHWGPRMEDTLRAACLTLARRPGSSLADIQPLLTDPGFRGRVIDEHGEPEGLGGFWADWAAQTTGQRIAACGPVVSRLRSVFSRRFARDLLAAPNPTFALPEILDGGVLLARLPKGVIGQDCAQLVGSLLLAGCWQAATARAQRPPDGRPDATLIVDEAHNFLHLPIGVDDMLAEARGYRLSLLLAHQHLAQLPTDVREAVDANARNKFYLTVSPTDAHRLARHVEPYFDAHDLAHRPAFAMTTRIVEHGQDQPPFTVSLAPLDEPTPGRARRLRAQARARTGLPRDTRRAATREAALHTRAGAAQLLDPPARTTGEVTAGPAPSGKPPRQRGRQSPRQRARQSPRHLEHAGEWRPPHPGKPLLTPRERSR